MKVSTYNSQENEIRCRMKLSVNNSIDRFIMNELLQTERAYCSDLKCCIEVSFAILTLLL